LLLLLLLLHFLLLRSRRIAADWRTPSCQHGLPLNHPGQGYLIVIIVAAITAAAAGSPLARDARGCGAASPRTPRRRQLVAAPPGPFRPAGCAAASGGLLVPRPVVALQLPEQQLLLQQLPGRQALGRQRAALAGGGHESRGVGRAAVPARVVSWRWLSRPRTKHSAHSSRRRRGARPTNARQAARSKNKGASSPAWSSKRSGPAPPGQGPGDRGSTTAGGRSSSICSI
jgi:hypothetical protein